MSYNGKNDSSRKSLTITVIKINHHVLNPVNKRKPGYFMSGPSSYGEETDKNIK